MTHRPEVAEMTASVPSPSGAPFVAPRAAQPQPGGVESVSCPTCRRSHPMVRCDECGRELPSHFLIHMRESCKAARRGTGSTESQ